MQRASGRRKQGEGQPPGETRKAIIQYLFEQDTGSAQQPEIREHLQDRYNITEHKGIRTQLGKLKDDGFIEDAPSRGCPTIWSLRPTQELLKWCYDRLNPAEFVRVYRSPTGLRIVADHWTPAIRDDCPDIAEIPDSDEVVRLSEDLQAWVKAVILVSPSVWVCLSQKIPSAISSIAELLGEFSMSSTQVNYSDKQPDMKSHEFAQICKLQRGEYIAGIYLGCLMVDAVEYTDALANEIDNLLASGTSKCLSVLFTPEILDRVKGSVQSTIRAVKIQKEAYTPDMIKRVKELERIESILDAMEQESPSRDITWRQKGSPIYIPPAIRRLIESSPE